MSRIHLGYGSEWHILRFLGRHRQYFTERVIGETGGSNLDWLDFDFTSGISAEKNYGDAELKGVNFLPTDHPVRQAWLAWWPQSGNVQNWDAVGELDRGGAREWLLVEAKGNIEELNSATGAKENGGLPVIRNRLNETQAACGIARGPDWTRPYYQYANRLAVLHFLTLHGVPARLLFIYFTGDQTRGRTCPAQGEWAVALKAMKLHLGLADTSALEQRVHHLFLPVVPLEKKANRLGGALL